MADDDFATLFADLLRPPGRKARSFDPSDPELIFGSRQKTCGRCGRTFFARPDVHFCSQRCQRDDRNQTRREQRAVYEYDLMMCANPDCSTAFQPIRSTARYCSNKCRQAMHRKRTPKGRNDKLCRDNGANNK